MGSPGWDIFLVSRSYCDTSSFTLPRDGFGLRSLPTRQVTEPLRTPLSRQQPTSSVFLSLLKGSAQLCLHPGLGLYASFLHGRNESCMVAFGLVGIGLSKRGNGAIE